MTHARNFAIVALLAFAVYAIPGGGTAANVIGAALFVAITVGLVIVAARLYQEHRVGLYSLGDRYRLLLYAAFGVAIWTLAAGPRLFETGAGTLLWFALIGGASYALYRVIRHAREYD